MLTEEEETKSFSKIAKAQSRRVPFVRNMFLPFGEMQLVP